MGRDAGTCGRWLFSKLRCASGEGCSPARALPTGSRLPTPTLWRRAGPGALTGLRSAARALPAGSMALPDLRVRPQRRPENGRRWLGRDAPVRSWCSAGPTAARPRAPTCRPQGRCGPRSFSTARATAAEPGSHRAARPQSRPCTQCGPRTSEPYAVLRAPSSQDQGVTCAFPWLSGDAWIISHHGIRTVSCNKIK